MTEGSRDVAALFEKVPPGWSEMVFRGHRYGVTRTVSAAGRIQKVFAEELGGTDLISANLYDDQRFRPCEMPAAKVLEFLSEVEPVVR